MIEPFSSSTPIKVFRDSDRDLWDYLENEYNVFSQFVFKILNSPSYSGLINESNLYFIADGFENSPVKELMFSKMEIFGAVKDAEGITILRGIKYTISPLLLIFNKRTYTVDNPIEEVIASLLQQDIIIFHPVISERRRSISSNGSTRQSSIQTTKRVSSIEIDTTLSIKDDLGEPEIKFPDYVLLSKDSITEGLKVQELSIVGTPHYTTSPIQDGTLCVLVARKDNPYDDHAIQVFRWIPVRKEEYGSKYVHPLYKLGYIPRTENHDLHEAMVKSNNYILFALYQQQNLSIIGNLKNLEQEPYTDYVLPYSLFNLLMK